MGRRPKTEFRRVQRSYGRPLSRPAQNLRSSMYPRFGFVESGDGNPRTWFVGVFEHASSPRHLVLHGAPNKPGHEGFDYKPDVYAPLSEWTVQDRYDSEQACEKFVGSECKDPRVKCDEQCVPESALQVPHNVQKIPPAIKPTQRSLGAF